MSKTCIDNQNIQPVFYKPVGLIPATDRTPDIYYCDDQNSEKVAALTFLTLWFLDKPIQNLVKQRVSTVISAMSPLSGGAGLEKALETADSVMNLTKRDNKFDFGSVASKYSGVYHFPQWKDGVIVKQGYMAIYATSVKDDERQGYTYRYLKKLSDKFASFVKVEKDSYYQIIDDAPYAELSVQSILQAFYLNDCERDVRLANVFRDEFSDIHTLYDMVPKRVAHEVGHLLEHGSNLIVQPFIQSEVAKNVPRKNAFLNHYCDPSEAIAELTGIALLQSVRRNANLDFGIPTTMLDKILPDSYAYVEKQVDLICQQPERLMGLAPHLK